MADSLHPLPASPLLGVKVPPSIWTPCGTPMCLASRGCTDDAVKAKMDPPTPLHRAPSLTWHENDNTWHSWLLLPQNAFWGGLNCLPPKGRPGPNPWSL